MQLFLNRGGLPWSTCWEWISHCGVSLPPRNHSAQVLLMREGGIALPLQLWPFTWRSDIKGEEGTLRRQKLSGKWRLAPLQFFQAIINLPAGSDGPGGIVTEQPLPARKLGPVGYGENAGRQKREAFLCWKTWKLG